ncbi:hypothetical protein RZS08_07020, partial [Arthrospira platensis SPKY1]|nr:hypothetical protein [Arthrospira platensis SPKY1]
AGGRCGIRDAGLCVTSCADRLDAVCDCFVVGPAEFRRGKHADGADLFFTRLLAFFALGGCARSALLKHDPVNEVARLIYRAAPQQEVAQDFV